MKIENENKKFFPPKATKTQDQQTWVMTYCLLTQKYASYKVGFSKKKKREIQKQDAWDYQAITREIQRGEYKEKDEKYSTAGSLGIAETRVS